MLNKYLRSGIGLAATLALATLGTGGADAQTTIHLKGPEKILKGASANYTFEIKGMVDDFLGIMPGWSVYDDNFLSADRVLVNGGFFNYVDYLIPGKPGNFLYSGSFTLFCDSDCDVAGATGTSGERSAEIYVGVTRILATPAFESNIVEVQCVPEPLTLLGASAAIAFGAGFKRRKKQG